MTRPTVAQLHEIGNGLAHDPLAQNETDRAIRWALRVAGKVLEMHAQLVAGPQEWAQGYNAALRAALAAGDGETPTAQPEKREDGVNFVQRDTGPHAELRLADFRNPDDRSVVGVCKCGAAFSGADTDNLISQWDRHRNPEPRVTPPVADVRLSRESVERLMRLLEVMSDPRAVLVRESLRADLARSQP